MPLPIAYSDFLNQNGALVNDGGPWTFTRSSGDVNCGTSQIAWCRDFANCLSCWVYPSASLSSYTVTFSVNISVPMNQYGNADSLDYDFSYQVDWASSKTARGTSLTSTSAVGSNSFSNNFAADDYEELLHTRQTWVGDPFSHSGNTAVVKSGSQTGYISLSVGLTFPREVSAYINYYMKGYQFRITTPTSVVETPAASTPNSPSPSSSPVSTSSTSSSLSSVTSTSLSSLSHTLAPDASTSQSADSGGGASIASSSSNSNPVPSNKVPTAAIAGGVMGAIALLSAFIILFLLYRRRKQRQIEEREKAMRLDADQQSFWVSPNSRPATIPPSGMPTTNINVPPNQHGVNPFVIPSHPPNSSGYAFDYGNGGGAMMAARGDGPPSPQNSISQWVQNQNNAQSQYHQRAPSVARTTFTGIGTDAPPPAYIAPSALGIDVPPLPTPRNFGYGTPRPLPPASVTESESFPASASQIGATSTSGRGTFVAADAGLSQWARENRSYITEKLEMKLDAAGYVPSDDPDNIGEEEWKRDWGVTKLELTRMRALYARTQTQLQTHSTGSQGPLVF